MMKVRAVYEIINQLARRIEGIDRKLTESSHELDTDKQIKRLAREMYKANVLSEAQSDQNKQTLVMMQSLLDENVQRENQAAEEARLEVIKALLPVLDAVEVGLLSGRVQIRKLQTTAPAATQILVGWLKGQQLLRERLLKFLEAEGVHPIKAIGQPFDPYRHVAVKTGSAPTQPANIVLRIERPGYARGDTILRYVEVIVNKPVPPDKHGHNK